MRKSPDSFRQHKGVTWTRLIGSLTQADLEVRDSSGNTPIMVSSQDGHEAIVQALITANADPNSATTDGLTALMAASTNGPINVVCELIAAGANCTAATRDGQTAYSMASDYEDENIVALLAAAEKFGIGAAQQPEQSLSEAIQEYCYRKPMFDELEQQYKKALKHCPQIASSGERARALRKQLSRFAEQRRQELLQTESVLKRCKINALRFVEGGARLTKEINNALLENDSFENFHVTLMKASDNQLLEMHELFRKIFEKDVSTRIAKLVLLRSDYRNLRRLLDQKAHIIPAKDPHVTLPAASLRIQQRRIVQSIADRLPITDTASRAMVAQLNDLNLE